MVINGIFAASRTVTLIQLCRFLATYGSRRRGSYSRPGGRVYEGIRRRVLWTAAWGKCFICRCNVSPVDRRRTVVRQRAQGEQGATEGVFAPCGRPALHISYSPRTEEGAKISPNRHISSNSVNLTPDRKRPIPLLLLARGVRQGWRCGLSSKSQYVSHGGGHCGIDNASWQ
jgi:hypothetical protein